MILAKILKQSNTSKLSLTDQKEKQYSNENLTSTLQLISLNKGAFETLTIVG